jgi:hypothetical protein
VPASPADFLPLIFSYLHAHIQQTTQGANREKRIAVVRFAFLWCVNPGLPFT